MPDGRVTSSSVDWGQCAAHQLGQDCSSLKSEPNMAKDYYLQLEGQRPCRLSVMRVLILSWLMTALPADAQPTTIAPWITGERLLKRWEQVNPADVTWSSESVLPSQALVAEHHTMMNYQFVEGYISALHDATEGKAWCYRGQSPKPDTFLDESRWGLHRLSKSQLKRNAANLLVEIWSEKWPCPTEQRIKK